MLLVLLIFTEEAPLSEKISGAYMLLVLPVIFAFIFVGVQSIVFGFFMEFVVRRLATRKFHIVLSAAVTGLLAAAIHRTDSPFNLFLGILVGASVGLFLSHSFQAGRSGNGSG